MSSLLRVRENEIHPFPLNTWRFLNMMIAVTDDPARERWVPDVMSRADMGPILLLSQVQMSRRRTKRDGPE